MRNDRFISQIAGTEREATGIVLAYEITIYEISDTVPPQDFPLALGYYRRMFDRVADAVIVKPRDAEETKYYMQDLQRHGKN